MLQGEEIQEAISANRDQRAGEFVELPVMRK
jgi:hypothetical protein